MFRQRSDIKFETIFGAKHFAVKIAVIFTIQFLIYLIINNIEIGSGPGGPTSIKALIYCISIY